MLNDVPNLFLINPFHTIGPFLYPLKTSEIQRFSAVFRRYRKKSMAWNGLTRHKNHVNWRWRCSGVVSLLLTSTIFNTAFSTLISTVSPKDIGRKLNVHKAFRKRHGCLLNVLYTFKLLPVSEGVTWNFNIYLPIWQSDVRLVSF